MGEIGYNRHEFLYELNYTDIICISRGYDRRSRNMWSAIRWQTYNTMGCWVDLKQAAIHSPVDLMKFPWEHSEEIASGGGSSIPSLKEAAEMRRQMQEYNKSIQNNNSKPE